MVTKTMGTDQLFLIAEKLSKDFSLLNHGKSSKNGLAIGLEGVLTKEQVTLEIAKLKNLSIDDYIEKTVSPTDDKTRPGAKALLKKLGLRTIREYERGPLYALEAEMDFGTEFRRIGFITQDRAVNNGCWGPEHHLEAIKILRDFTRYSIPVVTFIDTPGADAREEANKNNQAHTISALIAEMANVGVPTLGIVIGFGYSGGAIPLATTNLLMSVRDGVFNTIQPSGLASIARKYNLSWQECAKYVGVSSYELYSRGYMDAIIDFAPGEKGDTLINFKKAIVSGILSIESAVAEFVLNNKYIFEHSRRSIFRYLSPSEVQVNLQKVSHLHLGHTPTQQNNVFGVANRYSRYLNLRKKVTSMRIENYGRLAFQEAPKGEFDERNEKERKAAFFKWLQDPDKVIYDEMLHKTWKVFENRQEDRYEEKSRFTRLFLGDPQKKFEKATEELNFVYGFYLYNLWKSDAHSNFLSLIKYLRNIKEQKYLFQNKDIKDPLKFAQLIKERLTPLGVFISENLSYEADKVLSLFLTGKASKESAQSVLASELNIIISNVELYEPNRFSGVKFSTELNNEIKTKSSSRKISFNRKLLEESLASVIQLDSAAELSLDPKDRTILDVITEDDIREGFINVCENFLLFDSIYDDIVENLLSIAKEANAFKVISKESVKKLLDSGLASASKEIASKDASSTLSEAERVKALRDQFSKWLMFFIHHAKCGVYLNSLEEWKKLAFPRLSDTLFVIITFFFEKILPEYFQSEIKLKPFEGRISPKSIGPKKDFWNRISIAYNDLLIQEVLAEEKKQRKTTVQAFINTFFSDFEYHKDNNLMTANPVDFPGFRLAIEQALAKGITPCGVVTGIGRFKSDKIRHRVGVVISNLDFQAGAFDMASGEKFCKLLVDCAIRRLPVVCFISSGGMQTKEGAGALFSMAIINDRITRFVRDNDLPIIVFGFGDCTGGAQASFVTHPCVQTYYLSGTNMPFAGQIVVPSYLPSTATLSNYLSRKEGAMRGLVKTPFSSSLDTKLQEIDPNIPVPKETIEDVFVRIMKGSLVSQEDIQIKWNDMSLIRQTQRVLIHARGCTAVKLIRKAQEAEIQVVLVQSDPDMDSVAAGMMGSNDLLVCIGGNTPDESYLNAMSVIKIAEHEECDSLHPGIGFLSENSQFAEYCRNHSINFIGPSVYSMEMMGNKSNAIHTALKLKIPVVPGSHGILTGSDFAASVADQIGYPVLIKAVHGGGGKGIQVVRRPEDIHEIFHQLTAEARSAFGNGDVYLEKFITSLRHIEVQLLRDTHKNTKVLGLRDCSVQRNNQKLIEESGSTTLPLEFEQQVYAYTEAIANEINYVGAGTVEFIFDLVNHCIYFMEMNTRLQVEHPVTELVSGVDIVRKQFEIASGKSIADITPGKNGYAMEVRVNAEKVKISDNGSIQFIPNPGEVTEYFMPNEPGVEIISTIAKGKKVTPFYDSMVVQIICHGNKREDTIDKMIAYLDKVKIEGICTNIALIKRILNDETFRGGVYDTGFLPKFLANIDAKALIKEIEFKADVREQVLDVAALRIPESNEIKVVSPSTGIFYLTPTPSEPPFVKVGARIKTDQTICLLEAMKLFTRVNLETFNTDSGEIYPKIKEYEVTRVNKTTGQQVNVGDLLFVLRPLESNVLEAAPQKLEVKN